MFVPKNWGYEDWQINDVYCSKRLVVYEQYRCSIHMHKTKDEVIAIGVGLVWMETGESPDRMVGIWMRDNEHVRITPGTWHRFTGIRNAVMWEASTHHDEADTERNMKGGKIGEDEFRALLANFFAFENQDRTLALDNAGVLSDSYHKQGKSVGLYLVGNEPLDKQILFLQQARMHCETLFVGVPKLMDALTSILESCRYVDFVVMVEKDGNDVVKRLKPDVYVTVNPASLESQEAGKQGSAVIPIFRS
jgi:mannose-6-phosphate isomerase-like protein (cupin superfamily)